MICPAGAGLSWCGLWDVEGGRCRCRLRMPGHVISGLRSGFNSELVGGTVLQGAGVAGVDVAGAGEPHGPPNAFYRRWLPVRVCSLLFASARCLPTASISAFAAPMISGSKLSIPLVSPSAAEARNRLHHPDLSICKQPDSSQRTRRSSPARPIAGMSFMKAQRRLLPRGLTSSMTQGTPARATGGPGLNLHARGESSRRSGPVGGSRCYRDGPGERCRSEASAHPLASRMRLAAQAASRSKHPERQL